MWNIEVKRLSFFLSHSVKWRETQAAYYMGLVFKQKICLIYFIPGICSYCEPPNFDPNNQDFANYDGPECNGEDPNVGIRYAPFVTDYSNETTCAKEISCEFANNDRLFLIYTYPPANMTTCSNVGSSEGPVMLYCNENHEFTDAGGVYIFNAFVCRNSSSV